MSKMRRTSSMGSDPTITDQTMYHGQVTSGMMEETTSQILKVDMRNDNLSTVYCAAPMFSLDK